MSNELQQTPPAENEATIVENETTTNENQETPQENQPPAPVDKVETIVEDIKQPPAKKDKPKIVELKNSTAKKRVSYTTNLSEDQDNYIKPIVADLVKFGVVENQSDFVAKCIDFYINYQAVCKENNRVPTLTFPISNGENGSIAIKHKLLKQSLFTTISKMPTV